MQAYEQHSHTSYYWFHARTADTYHSYSTAAFLTDSISTLHIFIHVYVHLSDDSAGKSRLCVHRAAVLSDMLITTFIPVTFPHLIVMLLIRMLSVNKRAEQNNSMCDCWQNWANYTQSSNLHFIQYVRIKNRQDKTLPSKKAALVWVEVVFIIQILDVL